MNLNIKISVIILFSFALTNCNNSKSEKQLELNEEVLPTKEIQIDRQKISINDAIRLAEKQFENYLPKILESHDATLGDQKTYTGDFTGDGIEDVVIYFSLDGEGNTSVGQGLTLYQNSGYDVKVIAGYEPDTLFSFDKISNGNIYVKQLEFAEDDARCCPSIKTEHIITISGNNAY